MAILTEHPLYREKSQDIFEKACLTTPGGVNSPARAFKGIEQTPLMAERGYREFVVDPDGYEWIDYCGSWGALIHGHAHPAVCAVAKEAIDNGSSFGITTKVEAELAKSVVEKVPSMDWVRFVSSGTEATMSAVRVARGFTGRSLVIKFSGCYHGHADAFLVQAGSGVATLNSASSSAGVPDDFVKHTLSLPYNDLTTLKETLARPEIARDLAAIILEPIACNMGVVPPVPGFLEILREMTTKLGAVLIFDEVITGFRVAKGGVQELLGIEPDMTCLGKIVGGGFPAAAFGGKKEIMQVLAPLGPVYQAGTLSGNPVAMCAGLKALELIEEPGFYDELEEKATVIAEALKERYSDYTVHQVGSLFTLFFGEGAMRNLEDVKRCDQEAFVSYFQEAFKMGLYFAPSQFEANFVSKAHSADSIARTCAWIHAR